MLGRMTGGKCTPKPLRQRPKARERMACMLPLHPNSNLRAFHAHLSLIKRTPPLPASPLFRFHPPLKLMTRRLPFPTTCFLQRER